MSEDIMNTFDKVVNDGGEFYVFCGAGISNKLTNKHFNFIEFMPLLKCCTPLTIYPGKVYKDCILCKGEKDKQFKEFATYDVLYIQEGKLEEVFFGVWIDRISYKLLQWTYEPGETLQYPHDV